MMRPNQIQMLRCIKRVRWLLASLLCLTAIGVFAVEPGKSAAALARQASQVEQGGDPARAAELYLEAFRADATQPNFLYAAARAEMTARKNTEAEEHFEQFLGLAEVASDRADKARAYLAELRGARAENKESAADTAAGAGKWAEASKLYEELWVQMPSRWSALFKAGAAAQEAGLAERASDLLRQYLRDAPKSAADRPEAEDRLRQVASTHKEAEPDVAVKAPSAPAETGGGRVLGWTLVGTGAALVLGGAAVWLYGNTQERTLMVDIAPVNGYATGAIHYQDAKARADAAGAHQSLGLGLAGAGIVAAGVGTWLLLREPDKQPSSRVSVGPGPGWAGMSLTGRF
jgi:tetratricopeptide (TPR) repeat protein